MAVKLIANYAKRLGLPGYSSHQYSVSVEVEVTGVENIGAESERLYAVLQENVDQQIRETGFVPPNDYGMKENGNGGRSHNGNGNGHSGNGNGNGHGNGHQQRPNSDAGISEKQLDLVSRIMKENNLNKSEVEGISVEMFGSGVRALNRLQGSGLIDELFEKYPKQNGRGKYESRERTRA